MKKCWEINPECVVRKYEPKGGSPFRAIKSGDIPSCLAFRSGKGCWEVDWVSEISGLPEEAKEYCRQRMKEKCPKCPVYAEHGKELDEIIKKVQKI